MALVVVPLLATFAVACSADATTGTDASQGVADARTGNGVPDAVGIRPDAQDNPPQVDAMPQQVMCEGADTEPNDTQLGATSLTAIACGDGAGGDMVGSVISGNEDWFTYDSSDGNLCAVNPTFSIVGNVQVCAFFTCLAGDNELDLTCPAGDSTASGNNGCCTEGGFEVTSGNYNCLGTTDEASTTHVQITALSTDTCEAYTVSYNM